MGNIANAFSGSRMVPSRRSRSVAAQYPKYTDGTVRATCRVDSQKQAHAEEVLACERTERSGWNLQTGAFSAEAKGCLGP